MGRHMKSLGLEFDHVIASPALRVTETIDHLVTGYGETLAPEWDRRIYLASAATLLDIIRELPDAHARVLMVGHNPGLEDLVLLLVPDRAGDELRDGIEEKYPTAALAELTLDTDHWADFAANAATLSRFIRPRDVDAALGPDAKGCNQAASAAFSVSRMRIRASGIECSALRSLSARARRVHRRPSSPAAAGRPSPYSLRCPAAGGCAPPAPRPPAGNSGGCPRAAPASVAGKRVSQYRRMCCGTPSLADSSPIVRNAPGDLPEVTAVTPP